MSNEKTLEHIDAVSAFAGVLFLRIYAYSSAIFDQVAAAVQHLHLAFRHLRAEAADSDSLLRNAATPVFTRELRNIIENCDFALRHLETILENYEIAEGKGTERLVDRLAGVASRLINETTNVDVLLDTIQLNDPANGTPEVIDLKVVADLETIKDKVDKVASRLFQRRPTAGQKFAADDRLWQDFESELEREGFSREVLQRNKVVLRAYIRQLQSSSLTDDGSRPTLRGLLEREASSRSHQPSSLSKASLPRQQSLHPSDKPKQNDRRFPYDGPLSSGQDEMSFSWSFGDHSGDAGDKPSLISTSDLLLMDNSSLSRGDVNLHPPSFANSASRPKTESAAFAANVASSWPPPDAMAQRDNSSYSYGRSPTTVRGGSASQHSGLSSSPVKALRFAPDSYGQEIPPNATWTKVRRALISPEVLELAGVRYEARPGYVAILGRLSREQIEDYCRQSVECRVARSASERLQRSREQPRRRDRAGSHGSREIRDDEWAASYHKRGNMDHVDEVAVEDVNKARPYIVNPPAKDKTSPAATVMPKSILKNKNEHHVRFDPEPYEIEVQSSKSYDDTNDRIRTDGSRRYSDSSRRPDDRYRHYSRHDRERLHRREERQIRKKTWGETIGAVGIGGAAASLLGVLAEAAVGF